MKRALIFVSAILVCCQTVYAGGRDILGRFHPGLEWGYTLTPASFHHYNYLDESIGFRINDEGWSFRPKSNAYIFGCITYDVSGYFSVSMLSGIQGLDAGRRTLPLIMRMEVSANGSDQDGFIFVSDMGADIRNWSKHSNHFQIGSGYVIILAPRCSLGIRVGGRLLYDSPDIWDPIEEEYVSRRNIRRNDAWYCALNMGLVLKF